MFKVIGIFLTNQSALFQTRFSLVGELSLPNLSLRPKVGSPARASNPSDLAPEHDCALAKRLSSSAAAAFQRRNSIIEQRIQTKPRRL